MARNTMAMIETRLWSSDCMTAGHDRDRTRPAVRIPNTNAMVNRIRETMPVARVVYQSVVEEVASITPPASRRPW